MRGSTPVRWVMAFVAGTLLSCAEPPRRAGDSTLTVGIAVDPMGLDPADVTDNESVFVTEQLFEHLVRYRPGTTEVEPALATRWEVSEDGTGWTFHLRPGVHFHDGTKLNADAVVFSLERQRDPNHPFHFGRYEYWESTFGNIQRVEKVDAMTVRLVIDRPFAPFLANLAMFPVSIVSPTAARKHGRDFVRRPAGTGPFRFVEWVPGDRVVLEANPDYWGGPPRIQHLVFRIVKDARARLVGLEGAALDVVQALEPDDLQFVPLHPDLAVHKSAGGNVAYLAMNTKHRPFDDVRVRRAVNHAVNREAIVKLIYQGMAREATGPLPPTMWGYRRSDGYAYNPRLARRMIEEVGPKLDKKPRMYVMQTPRPYLPTPERVARIVERNLDEAGLPVEVSVFDDWGEYRKRVFNGEHDLCFLGWIGDNGDPDNFLYVLLDRDNAVPPKAQNVALYDSAELHGLLIYGRESNDRAERERLYLRAQEIIEADAPWVPLAHSELVIAARKSVRGLVLNFDGTLDFGGVQKVAEGEEAP